MNSLTINDSINVADLEFYIQKSLAQWSIPGLSLAIVKDGQPVLVKGYGIRNIGKDIPVDKHTLFPIAWGTRLITSSALALLVAEGKLSWGDRLTDILPWFKTGSALINQEATVTDALAWRIGMPLELLICWSNPSLSRRELLDKLQHINKPMGFRDGQGKSELLLIAAGEIIPAITGISWDDFIRDRLFVPLGMTASLTGPHLLGAHANVALPHDTIDGQLVSMPHSMISNMGPSRSVYSNAADMARWLQFQLDNGKIGDQQLIPQLQIDQMRKIHQAMPMALTGCVADLSGQGLGVNILTSHNGYRVYGSGSGTEGGEAFYSFIPELNLGIAAMVNTNYALPQKLIPWIIDRYTGAHDTDWLAGLSRTAEAKATKKQKQEQQREQLTDPSKPASLPLAAYTGVYQHPYLGNFFIREEPAGLVFTFGEIWEGKLHHANHNTFFREPVAPMFCRFQFVGPLRFNLSIEENVESLTIDKDIFIKFTVN